MPPAGFEPTIPASKRPQTHTLDDETTGIDLIATWSDEVLSTSKSHVHNSREPTRPDDILYSGAWHLWVLSIKLALCHPSGLGILGWLCDFWKICGSWSKQHSPRRKHAKSRIQTSVCISAHEQQWLFILNLTAHINTLALVKYGVSLVLFILTLVLFTFCTCCILRSLVCIVVSCLVCIVVILCVFVVLCVYCCFYFRCRTAG